ncbi:mitoguardin-like [Tigriopus californicus]|uniref:mitoguardin-like n=1 Tax=Tigriopus californicus TaxID=6832 RepID=UPI0027D9CF55|nr:mitoguardin-like [Tigriopus californicus]
MELSPDLDLSENLKRTVPWHETVAKMTQLTHKLGSQISASLWFFKRMNLSQKLALIGVGCSGVVLLVVSRYCHRPRAQLDPHRSIRAARRARQISLSKHGSTSNDSSSRRGLSISSYNWSELQRQSVPPSSDKDSITSGATLVDGTPLTPQQLGLMGMEALETVTSYWEDALSAYHPSSEPLRNALTTSDETKFMHMLENLLECAYQLQEDGEALFIHQNSILNQTAMRRRSRNGQDWGGQDDASSRLLSVTSVDDISFVSAQDTIADLRDFDDLNEVLNESDPLQRIYVDALQILEDNGEIPFRALRTEFVGCDSDSEYLAKLHCLRLAFKKLMSDDEIRIWWIDSGRKILSELLVKSDRDPKDFVTAYDDLIAYLSNDENLEQMSTELESRNVKCINLYDVLLDYILIDSFEDLESPPSSVLAVMKNRWLSNSFKEGALHTAIWSVLKAKRRLLKVPNGFKAQFYNLSEILTPTLAWGFFGPDEHLNNLMLYFKNQVLDFIHDMYNFQLVRFSSVEDLSVDIMTLARSRFESVQKHLELDEPRMDAEVPN